MVAANQTASVSAPMNTPPGRVKALSVTLPKLSRSLASSLPNPFRILSNSLEPPCGSFTNSPRSRCSLSAEPSVQRFLSRKILESGSISKALLQTLSEARVSTSRAEQAALLTALGQVRGQLERLRQFILGGDTSARVREWLAEAEREEARLLQGDIERIAIHPEVPKPYPKAEIVTTGRGLLERVAFVVAGAGFEPATFGL